MAKLENDKKFLSDADDGAEFEIPDISLIEQYPDMADEGEVAEAETVNAATAADGVDGVTDESADASEGENESGELAATADKAEAMPEAENEVIPDNDAAIDTEAEAMPENENGAEATAEAEVDTEATSENETADEAKAMPEAENEVIPDNDAAIDTEAGATPENENDAEATAEAEIDAEAMSETEAEAEAEAEAEEDTATEAEDRAEKAEAETFEKIAEPEVGAEAIEPSEKITEPAAEQFEIDESGRRVIPEGYIPDDALYTPASSYVADGTVTDLLGDPMREASPDEPAEDVDTDPEILPITEEEIRNTVPSEEKYDPERPRRIDVIFDFVELLIFTLVAVLFVTSFFFKHAVVDGPSMLGTLEHGDVLIISDLFYEPEPGDIVVFEDHTLRKENYRKPIVKRVLAVEGQRVMIKRDGIYVGYAEDPEEPLYEPYVFTDDEYYTYDVRTVAEEIATLDSFGCNSDAYWFIVPEGEIFVLGDHRDDSTDSRILGTIRVDAVLGKVLFRIFPFEKLGGVDSTFDYAD